MIAVEESRILAQANKKDQLQQNLTVQEIN